MAITYSIPLGAPVAILQNQVYALPSRACYIVSDVNLEGAFNLAGPWTAAVGNSKPEGALTLATFIRCPTANATVVCKRL